MTRTVPVIVNDASCLIDLRKAGLLEPLLRLPFRLVIPLPVRVSELLDFTPAEQARIDGGMEIFDLPPDRVAEALTLRVTHPGLSANDCFCVVTTRCHSGAILLTGDRQLRRVALDEGHRVHGVLWVVDELLRGTLCEDGVLVSALEVWRDDPTVFIPGREIESRLGLIRG